MAAIPQDIMTQANAIGAGMDSAMAQGAEIVVPTGRYSARAMNALVEVLNRVLPMMGRTDMYPEFTDDQTQFPMDLTQLLMAIKTVADTAQVEFPLDLGAITGDADVAKVAAIIQRLVDDKRFQDYLAQEETMEAEEMVEVETPMAGSAPQPQGEMSDEELFASRMG